MEIKRLKINMQGHEHDVQFINNTWETSYAWGHETTLFVDDFEINYSKCRYYNRTWERYAYQSVMKSCVYNHLANLKHYFINDYKSKNNIKRLCGKKLEDCNEKLHENYTYSLFEKIYKEL